VSWIIANTLTMLSLEGIESVLPYGQTLNGIQANLFAFGMCVIFAVMVRSMIIMRSV